jgi:5-oxoprolinase (ATP-hydrolysing)
MELPFSTGKWMLMRREGKNTASMKPGERIIVCTPGGGGYGNPKERKGMVKRQNDPTHSWKGGSLASRVATQETN